jgi:hypothetical protein
MAEGSPFPRRLSANAKRVSVSGSKGDFVEGKTSLRMVLNLTDSGIVLGLRFGWK